MLRRLTLCVVCFCVAIPAWAQEESAGSAKSLEFVVHVIHLKSKTPFAEEGQELKGEQCLKALAEWRKQGVVEQLTTMRMSAVENQLAQVQIGESSPIARAANFFGRGGGEPVRQYSMEQTGTIAQCTGRIQPDGKIVCEYTIEETRLVSAKPESNADGKAENSPNAAIDRSSKQISQTKSLIRSNNGETQLVAATWGLHKSEAQDSQTYSATLVLFMPRVIEDQAQPK